MFVARVGIFPEKVGCKMATWEGWDIFALCFFRSWARAWQFNFWHSIKWVEAKPTPLEGMGLALTMQATGSKQALMLGPVNKLLGLDKLIPNLPGQFVTLLFLSLLLQCRCVCVAMCRCVGVGVGGWG